jgi:predicted ferric reductase
MSNNLSNPSKDPIELNQPILSWPWLILALLAVVGGTLFVAVFLPKLAPSLANSLMGENPKAFWYLSRGSAIVAFILIWASMALGLLITNKMARLWPGGPAAFELHEYVSLLGLGFALFHGLILTGDRFIHYNLVQVLLPFGSFGFKPFWVGLGQIAFYLTGILAASFYLRKPLGGRTWRVIHYASFLAFVLALVHGLASGTDSSSLWMKGLYGISASTLLFLFIYRVALTLAPKSTSSRALSS